MSTQEIGHYDSEQQLTARRLADWIVRLAQLGNATSAEITALATQVEALQNRVTDLEQQLHEHRSTGGAHGTI